MRKVIIFIVSGIVGCVVIGSSAIGVAANMLASTRLIELARVDLINAIATLVPSMIVVGALSGFAARGQQVSAIVVALGASLGWLAGTFAVFALVQRVDMPINYATVMQVVAGWMVAVLALMLADKATRGA